MPLRILFMVLQTKKLLFITAFSSFHDEFTIKAMLLSQLAESSLFTLISTDMIPALHKHSSLQNFFGQSTIFACGIIFMQLIVIFENFLFSNS